MKILWKLFSQNKFNDITLTRSYVTAATANTHVVLMFLFILIWKRNGLTREIFVIIIFEDVINGECKQKAEDTTRESVNRTRPCDL